MSTFPSEPRTLEADYFDGKTARAHRVTLSVADSELVVAGETVARREPLRSLRVSEPMGAAPRLISFPDGAHCEVRDHAALNRLLHTTGHQDSFVVQLQRYWTAALASVVISVAALAAAYVWGLPAASSWIAFKLPESVLAQLGSGTLDLLDRALLQPTELPAARQEALRTHFAQLVVPGEIKSVHRIEFRKGGAVGSNALALPDGTMVVTDELLALARDDEEIMAVLTHELGHLNRRHSVRMLIQSSIVAFIVGWYLGDVTSVAAGLPTLLLQARYSRQHEREADRYAVEMLKANGISPHRLGSMLESMEAERAAKVAKQEGKPVRERSAPSDYLSSHPATRERIEELSR